MSEEDEKELKKVQEESRLKVLTDRRRTIRGILKSAEGTKNFRIKNGYVPEIDPEENAKVHLRKPHAHGGEREYGE